MVIKKYLILFSLVLTFQLSAQVFEYNLEASGFEQNFKENDVVNFKILGDNKLLSIIKEKNEYKITTGDRTQVDNINSINLDGYYLSQFKYFAPFFNPQDYTGYTFQLTWKKIESYKQDNELIEFFKGIDTSNLQEILSCMMLNKDHDTYTYDNPKERAMKVLLLFNKEELSVLFSCNKLDINQIKENLLENHKLENLVPSK